MAVLQLVHVLVLALGIILAVLIRQQLLIHLLALGILVLVLTLGILLFLLLLVLLLVTILLNKRPGIARRARRAHGRLGRGVALARVVGGRRLGARQGLAQLGRRGFDGQLQR